MGQGHRQAGGAHTQQATGSWDSHATSRAGVPGCTAVCQPGNPPAAEPVYTGQVVWGLGTWVKGRGALPAHKGCPLEIPLLHVCCVTRVLQMR